MGRRIGLEEVIFARYGHMGVGCAYSARTAAARMEIEMWDLEHGGWKRQLRRQVMFRFRRTLFSRLSTLTFV